MTANLAGGMKNSSAFAGNQKDELFSLSSGNYLTRFEVHGILNTAAVNNTFAVGQFYSHAQCAGLQYGAAGYGGIALTSGNTSGATWVTWGTIVQGTDRQMWQPGSSPQSQVFMDARQLNISWRGLWKVPFNADFYLCCGFNPGQTVTFGANYEWYAEWAS